MQMSSSRVGGTGLEWKKRAELIIGVAVELSRPFLVSESALDQGNLRLVGEAGAKNVLALR